MPDKSHYVLASQLDICGKCKKQCIENEKAIQCDLCCMWVHTDCEGITEDQYNAIETLSTTSNSIYYCSVNNCLA